MKKKEPQKPPLRVKPPYAPKLTKSVILVCTKCTARYIKTRLDQVTCIQCLVGIPGQRN